MKLIYDLAKSLFSRLAVLLLVASALILIEANNQNQTTITKTETRINNAINKIDKQINIKRTALNNKTKRQKTLKEQIAQKTSAIEKYNDSLEKSRNAKLKDKLPPWKVVGYLDKIVKLNVERAPLLIEYSQVMFSIVDINKYIANKTLKKTELNNKLIITQTSNMLDFILQQDSPTDLLTGSDWTILLILFYGMFFGPLTIKAFNYYLFAPLAKKTTPITINPDSQNQDEMIHYDAPQKEFKLQVDQASSLVVKPGWYSLNTEGLTRTRFFWDSANPFACYAMGLVNMTEFESDHDQSREITLASDEDPNQDIQPVHLNNHPGYVVRHGHVVATSGNDLVMKKKWQFWDWKSWLFGNIRYVYFTGTGKIYISGHGKVSTNDTTANSRIKERHVIGFDTRTPFKMLRTETFANYWLNNKPLYDIHFPEHGRFLQQQSFGQRDDKIFRSLLEDILGAIGKLLGF
ncbi:MAG: AIM24 family protein [Thioalkalispiraceae bacterium]